jgi:choline dehydrogenase-like flavoprotein
MTDPVLIVGAGPTGLTAALELSRMGVAVRLIEVRRKAVKVEWASQCRYLPDAVKLLSRTIPTFHFRGRRWPLAKPAAAASPARVKLNFVDFRAGKHGMENCGNPPGPGVGGRFSIDQVVARFDQKTCEAPAGDLLV